MADRQAAASRQVATPGKQAAVVVPGKQAVVANK